MAEQGTGYFMNQGDRDKVDDTIRRVQRPTFKQDRPTTNTGAPPVRFGVVASAWSLGDTTVNVIPARFDDFATSLSNTDAIDVYVMYHQYARYIDDYLEADAVIPYIPFQGEDGNGVAGIVAGQFIIPNLNPFAAQYTLDGSDPAITLNDGMVFYEKEVSGVTVSAGSTKYKLETDQFFWVEIIVTANEDTDPTIAINPAVQTDAAAPDYWDETSGVITLKWLIAEIDGTAQEFYQRWEGDIDLKSLYMPGFDTDYQGDATNEGLFAAVKDATSSLAGKTYFLKMNDFKMRYGLGELIKYTKGTDYEFGGTDDDDDIDVLSTIDTTVEDEITFESDNMDWDVDAGLVQAIGPGTAPSDIIIKALGKWVGIEIGGTFKHKNSPVTSTSDAEHWFYYSFSGVKNGAGGTVTITIYVDIKGHIWKVDTEEQPPPVENWRYTHCSDASTYPDLIFASQQANTVILVDDECYKEVGETEKDATSPTPTVDSTYSTCVACEAALTKEYWKDCDTDSDQAVLDDTHTDVDYAWLCISGALKKCYNDRPTADTATNPTVLKQCGLSGAPTSCNDLVGWPSSDDFGGTDCNTGSIGDTNWGVRWTPDSLVWSIISSVLVGSPGSSSEHILDNNMPDVAGNFSFSGTMSSSNWPNGTGSAQSQANNFVAFTSGSMAWGFLSSVAAFGNTEEQGLFISRAGQSDVYVDTTNFSSRSWTLVRSGSTVTLNFGGVNYTYTNSNTLNRFLYFLRRQSGYSAWDCSFDSLVLQDGSSNELYIDPTGDSCT